MTSAALLTDLYDRIRGTVHRVLDDMPAGQLTYRLDPQANTIAWLIWHLARVQDDHVAEVAGREQVWTAQGWVERFDLPFQPAAIGYGQSSDEVGQVQVDAGLLRGYFDAVHEQSRAFLATLDDEALTRVVDERFDPPVTLAARLVSVAVDDLQHAGQAAFIVGVAQRA